MMPLDTLMGGAIPPIHPTPLLARTHTIHRPIGPVSYRFVQFSIVRDGSALLFSEFGQKHVTVGDVTLLGPEVLCRSEPDEYFTVTTIAVDNDYALDQLFWQYAPILGDRLAAEGFAEKIYTEAAQVMRLGEERTGLLMPWLDELARLSIDGGCIQHFHRMQALWFLTIDVITPHVRVSPMREHSLQRVHSRLINPYSRPFLPVRKEAQEVATLLRAEPERAWTLEEMAQAAHLSVSRFGQVFAETFGLTPMAYLTRVRAKGLADLLRDTDLPIEDAMYRVGWRNRGHAARYFRRFVGMTPRSYRIRTRGHL